MHQSSTWKLLTLVGIIVVGCMVILQVQKGLPVDGQKSTTGVLDGFDDTQENFDFDFGDDTGITSEVADSNSGYGSATTSEPSGFDLPGEQREPAFEEAAGEFAFNDPPPRDEPVADAYYDENPFSGQSEPAPTPVNVAQEPVAGRHGFSAQPGRASLGSVDDEILFEDEDPGVESFGDAPTFEDTLNAPEPSQKTSPTYFSSADEQQPPANNPIPVAVEDAFGDFLDDTADTVNHAASQVPGAIEEFEDVGSQFVQETIPLETNDGFDALLEQDVPARRSVATPQQPVARTPQPYQRNSTIPLPNERTNVPRINRGQPATYRQEGDRIISQATAGARPVGSTVRQSGIRQAGMSQSTTSGLIGSGTLGGAAANSSLRPQLQIKKLMPQNAVLGQPLIYQIIVSNTGNARARQVVVEDQVPSGCELHGTKPQARLDADQKDKLVWNLGDLEPNHEQKISVRIIPTAEGQIGSVATVNFAADVSSQTTITAPKLNIHLVGPKEVMIGDPVVYKYRITNQGTGEASNVIIRSLVPAGLEHPDGNDLEYNIGSLSPGKSRDVVLTLAAVKPGDLLNSAIVSADGGIEKEVQAPVTVIGRQLVVTRRGPARRYIGREGTYENVVRNDSTRPAIDAVVLENIPPGMKYISSNANGQYSESRRQVAWRIPKLNSGEVTKLQVTLLPTDSGEQVSLVQVMEKTGLKSQAKTKTDVEHLMTMGLDISEVDGSVTVGDKMRFTIRARNRGTGTTHNVKLSLEVPAALRIISAGPNKATPVANTASGTEIAYDTVGSIPAGEARDFTITVQAAQLGAGLMKEDVRLRARIQSEEMPKLLQTERAIMIYSDR